MAKETGAQKSGAQKSCREVGRWGRRELCEAGTLLPGEESMEPWIEWAPSGVDVDSGLLGRCGAGRTDNSEAVSSSSCSVLVPLRVAKVMSLPPLGMNANSFMSSPWLCAVPVSFLAK